MATPNFAKKNPFMGMTVKQMKEYYDKKVRGKNLSAAQLKNMADQMQSAKKAAPKAKPAASKPSQSTRPSTRSSSRSQTRSSTTATTKTSQSSRSSSGTRGTNLPSNPPLRSQATKPKRSSFPSGRAGANQFSRAVRNFKAAQTRVQKPTIKRNRRGRAI